MDLALPSANMQRCVCCLLQVHVPDECIGWQYERLWAHMLQHKGMLLLGLYRPVVQQGRCFCAVLTNPVKVG